jgi:hypothetical protein
MNSIKKIISSGLCFVHRVAPWALAVYFWVLTSPLAWAAKKKAADVAPTKSYVVPYMIVIALVSIGLMTIVRPGKRLDKALDMKVKEEE